MSVLAGTILDTIAKLVGSRSVGVEIGERLGATVRAGGEKSQPRALSVEWKVDCKGTIGDESSQERLSKQPTLPEAQLSSQHVPEVCGLDRYCIHIPQTFCHPLWVAQRPKSTQVLLAPASATYLP